MPPINDAPETGRVALITGGEGDLACAIADALSKATNGDWTIHSPGRAELNVCDAEAIQAYRRRLSRLDLLIHNAGITKDTVHLKMDEAEWDGVVDTHLKGAFLVNKAFLPLLLKARQGGQIIQIGSFSAEHPPVGQSNYAAAKAALVGYTKSLAREYGKRNLRANVVLPGFLETKMTAGLSDQAKQRIRQRHALDRYNTVQQSARFIAQLADFDHISGQVFQLDSRV